MILNHDSYELDGDGNRVLFGLSVEETQEFINLESLIAITSPIADISSDEWRSPNEKRWLELYQKHQSAIEPFLRIAKTQH